MTDCISDRLAVSDLINGWMLRDNGEWDKRAVSFIPTGT